MILTKTILLLVFGISITSVALGSQDTEKIVDLRNKRQAIYQEFCFNSPTNALANLCDLFAIDPKNIDFFKKIDAEIQNRKLLFAHYAYALLDSVRAGDLDYPEELCWAANWDDINVRIGVGLATLQKDMVENITNGKDPEVAIDSAKASFDRDLESVITRLIGQKIIARCTTQIS